MRTMVQINNDYNVCKKYVDEHPSVSSLKEIAKAVGLSESQVNTSLSRHPRVFSRIMKQIEGNKETKLQKKSEVATKFNSEPKKSEDKKLEKSMDFVIDASIVGIDCIIDTIKEICNTQSKIILTSVTIRELEQLQKFHDIDANHARKILAMAVGDYEHFKCVLIDESLKTPDDCIIKYCADNKDDIILMTSDKAMELKARTYNIKSTFLKHSNPPAPTGPEFDTRAHSLYVSRKVGKKLIVSYFGNEFKSVRIISNGIEYNEGTVELKIGDDVYIATKKKENYMTFSHYKIISLTVENNCKLIFSNRLYSWAKINYLPEEYKSFMNDFKNKIEGGSAI